MRIIVPFPPGAFNDIVARLVEHAAGPGQPLPALWHWIYFTPKARARDIGIDVPIIPGIMPITNAGQIRKKLAGLPAPRLVTEPGVGYRLVDDSPPPADD